MARLDGIIDISHHQSGTVDFAGLRQLGIVAVIHKATQGTHFINSQYATRRKAAESAGLLWGAYHFGEEDSKGADQAAFFLSKIGEPTGTFVCLDFETYFRKHDPVTPHTMSLADAHDFVDTVHERLGRVPFFYSGATIRNVLGKNVDQKLATCPLWAAGYVSEQNLKFRPPGPTGHSGNTLTENPTTTPIQSLGTAPGIEASSMEQNRAYAPSGPARLKLRAFKQGQDGSQISPIVLQCRIRCSVFGHACGGNHPTGPLCRAGNA